MPSAHMHGIADARDLLDALAELAARRRAGEPTYPFCCALFWMGLAGRDNFVADYVGEAWHVLDQATGSNCVVFAATDAPAARHSLKPDEIASLARALDIPLASLPCAVVFTDPVQARNVLVLPFGHYVARAGNSYDPDAMMQLFMALSDALARCANTPEKKRLQALSRDLSKSLKRVDGNRTRKPTLQQVAAGATVLQTLIAGATLLLGAPTPVVVPLPKGAS
jgi:uncharacterized membrane protein